MGEHAPTIFMTQPVNYHQQNNTSRNSGEFPGAIQLQLSKQNNRNVHFVLGESRNEFHKPLEF